MDFQALRTLIETHPTHAVTTDVDMVTWLNDPTAVTRDQETITASAIFDTTLNNPSEWSALAAEDKQTVRDILTINESVPTASGAPTRTRLIAILGTATKAEVAALIPEDVSRAVDADLGTPREGDVAFARTFGD